MFSDVNPPPSVRTIVATAASVAASALVVRSIARDALPYELQKYFFLRIQRFFKSFSNEIVLVIEESDGLRINQLYKAADVYIGAKISPSITRFMVTMPHKESKISTSMPKNQEVTDKFNGVKFKWRQITESAKSSKRTVVRRFSGQSAGQQSSEMRYFELCFNKKHKKMVFESYFPFLLKEAEKVKEEKKTLKIHTLSNDRVRRFGGHRSWSSIKLDHPATFENLAMDTELKKMIMDDLAMFMSRKEFYRKVGKAWKRGYLLYGPPGTGKSSLIAAMANYLNFDIYDLELADIHTNSDLRRLLINTANHSILVFDCSLELGDRKEEENALKMRRPIRKSKLNQITLSGLLNFIDGLWSSCGDERIIVATTHQKESLDPALLRPGRMDMHIHMSYCTPCSFRILAHNYLGIEITNEINESLLEEAMVTPADVAEQLMRMKDDGDPERALEDLIEFLQLEKKKKKNENEVAKAKRLQEKQATTA